VSIACAKTAFEAGGRLGLPCLKEQGSLDRLRRSLTIWLDAEVMFVRTFELNRGDSLAAFIGLG
jgi:hypothetical protein